ncbi:hypothetical protein LTR36_003325 [Oleoguttula mirabilis]|uniref:Uncharacterized protein n=1 Tax=Oleoguttula mirabilis TaxID=1507867 RepID=A0AAV9JXM9_9PEZI|nr:hypothetical protein LTR36_003325 [Oleoguttula mirabilis]
MYVESRPVSTYRDTEGWKMPSPQPTGTLKRPPTLKNGSSSSSLRGMEQTVPSFQSFVKRTPPPDQQKPLPPTPLRPRRPSSFESASSRPPSTFDRRSSSVYSRTLSQWDPYWDLESEVPDVPALPSWRSIDFADQSTLLRPIAYSHSTSELLEKPQSPQLLQARTYRPLITTPSPTVSRQTTPSPPPHPRPSILLPPPPAVAHVPRQHLRTVSLEKAKELMQAPNAVHLLPEELRAQTLGKSRSQEPIRIASMGIFADSTPPELPASPTLIDNQGRERLLSSPTISFAAPNPRESDFPDMWSPVHMDPNTSFHVGNGPIRTMAPVASQRREASRDKAAQALGLGDADEPRGRTSTRGPRNTSYDHYMLKAKRTSDSSEASAESQSEAQKVAQEYHALLSEQYRQSSNSPASNAIVSDTELGTQMKMVPQPLFQGKRSARPPGDTNSIRGSEHSVSPFGMRADSGIASSMHRRSSGSRGSFPLRLSLTPYSGHRRRSTSGSIPISPPSASMPKKVTIAFPPTELEARPRKQSARRRTSEDLRASLYYPHVMTRKNKQDKKGKGKGKGSSNTNDAAPPMPLLAADIIAQRLKTPESSPSSSPLRGMASCNDIGSRSDAGSIRSGKSSRPLRQRMFKGAARYADKLSARSASPAGRKRSDESSRLHRLASPESPHLLPSPVHAKQPPDVHLGWSDYAKTTFDRVRSSVHPPRRLPEPLITHVITPAKPLDDSRAGLTEPESPGSPGRKNSIFGGLMDSWRESKAEKRREELKKMIKVVAPDASGNGGAEEARPAVGRRMSSFGWM